MTTLLMDQLSHINVKSTQLISAYDIGDNNAFSAWDSSYTINRVLQAFPWHRLWKQLFCVAEHRSYKKLEYDLWVCWIKGDTCCGALSGQGDNSDHYRVPDSKVVVKYITAA